MFWGKVTQRLTAYKSLRAQNFPIKTIENSISKGGTLRWPQCLLHRDPTRRQRWKIQKLRIAQELDRDTLHTAAVVASREDTGRCHRGEYKNSQQRGHMGTFSKMLLDAAYGGASRVAVGAIIELGRSRKQKEFTERIYLQKESRPQNVMNVTTGADKLGCRRQ